MAETISNDLLYEVLKSIQSRLDKLEAGQTEVKQELVSVRGHMLAMQHDIHNVYEILARQDDRFERIEHRLDLRELSEPPQQPYDPST